jgi:hypothetical protein
LGVGADPKDPHRSTRALPRPSDAAPPPRGDDHPPCLDPALPAPPVEPRAALLINPFYPKDPHASFGKHVLTPTLAMSYLYKRSNRVWHFLIRRDLTHAVWRPLIEASRRRHLAFRRRLAARAVPAVTASPESLGGGTLVSPGV